MKILLIKSEYNDSCNCHPEMIYETHGYVNTVEEYEEFLKTAPKQIEVRPGITKYIDYSFQEISQLTK